MPLPEGSGRSSPPPPPRWAGEEKSALIFSSIASLQGDAGEVARLAQRDVTEGAQGRRSARMTVEPRRP